MDAPRGGAKEKKWIASILIWIQHFLEALDPGPDSVLQYSMLQNFFAKSFHAKEKSGISKR